VEVLFPIEKPALIRRLKDEMLHAYLNDHASARRMYKDGSYAYKSRNGGPDSQAWFLAQRITRQTKSISDTVQSS